MQYRTQRPFAMRLLCVALASLMSACGGGGSSQQPTAVVQPTVVPTPSPSPTPSPTPSQPLALTPKVDFGDVVLNGGPALRRVGEDRFASVGKLLVNDKALQVIQALTGDNARLSVVSDPDDRQRYLVLLRTTAVVGNMVQASEHLCTGGTWSTSDLNALLRVTGVQSPACTGDIQFVDSNGQSRVILNGVNVASRLAQQPAVTVTAYLDTTNGTLDFQSFDPVNHLFRETGLPAMDQLEIINSPGGNIASGIHQFRFPMDEMTIVPAELSDGLKVDLTAIHSEEAQGPALYLIKAIDSPDQFVLVMPANPQTNLACRSPNLSEAKAVAMLEQYVATGIVFNTPGSPVDTCNGVNYTPTNHRLRMQGTVLTRKRVVRGALAVTHSSTISANLNIWPYQ